LTLAAVIGFALVPSATGSGDPALPNSAANRTAELSLPADWRRTPASARPPGPMLSEALPVESVVSAGALVVGMAQSSSPTLLPKELLGALLTRPGSEDVRLGTVAAYRYRNLKPEGSAAVETVYAIPTTSGVLLGICPLPEQQRKSHEAICERILSSLTLLSSKALPLGPQRSYANTLGGAFSSLNAARSQFGTQLHLARTADAQASAARQLGQAHRRAARLLRSASPGPAESSVNASIVSALDWISAGYAAMAKAAQAKDESAFNRGRAVVEGHSRILAKTVSELSGFGYRIGGG
jgi:hypothetical protein